MSKTFKKTHTIIGLMSGTSLDGVDLVCCTFTYKNGKWSFTIKSSETVKYNLVWKNKLKQVENESALQLALLDVNYGHYLGKLVKSFIYKYNLQPDFVASHGHTVFHQPKNKLTKQIGSGAAIAAEVNLPVVCDFRSLDVALGGQGAPLVPIGDKLLFSNANACINLGGFANISYSKNSRVIAYDICPVNIVLNALAEKLGKEYDKGGSLAKKGKVNLVLLDKLNHLSFYGQKPPRSLGKEWVLENIFPLLNSKSVSVVDQIRTFTEHAAIQIANELLHFKKDALVLYTGGGTFNDFLMQRIQHHTHVSMVIPDRKIIEYKEAIIFAFLGLLRMLETPNALRSVTGSVKDNVGGCVYFNN